MNDALYDIILNDEFFNVSLLNNGDYKQTYSVELNIVNDDSLGNYEAELIVTPIHHPENSKIYNISLSTNNQIDNNITEVTLNPNQNIILTFGSNILDNQNIINEDFKLSTPYPNPFNPNVYFNIEMLHSQNVNIIIYDIYGKKIETIFNGILNNGLHNFEWEANNYSAGIYIIECKTKTAVSTEKVYLIK